MDESFVSTTPSIAESNAIQLLLYRSWEHRYIIYVHTSLSVYLSFIYIYIYIYIEKERERER